jgi:hypothetical protein
MRRAPLKRMKTPETLAHGGQEAKPPKRFRRLRVVGDTSGGYMPRVRDVYLESSACPLMLLRGENCRVELMNCGLSMAEAADLIRWAWKVNLPVVYDPPGNMDGHLCPKKKNGEQTLFD